MRSFNFFVRSSSTSEVYLLKATRNGEQVASFVCSCMGSQMGALCKHRLNLACGDVSKLVTDRSDDPSILKEVFAGTHIEQSLSVLLDLEAQTTELKRRLVAQKKLVARYMFGLQ